LKGKLYKDFCALSRDILRLANNGAPLLTFLSGLSDMLFSFSGVDEIEILMMGGETNYHWVKRSEEEEYLFNRISSKSEMSITELLSATSLEKGMRDICMIVSREGSGTRNVNFTSNGSFWTGDSTKPLRFSQGLNPEIQVESEYKTIAVIKFIVNEFNSGLLILKSEVEFYFTEKEIEFYEGVVQTLGVAISDRRAQEALRERVKELTCLYGITKVLENTEIGLGTVLQRVTAHLPLALQYPELASARIVFKDEVFCSPDFCDSGDFISAEIKDGVDNMGKVEVFYKKATGLKDEILFLEEEKSLIETVAKQVSIIIERRIRAEEKERLQFQLRHADRLATIGQLAAGIAHELNEPLGNILGYAQLISKEGGLSEQTVKDIGVIVKSSLYAREIIKKLMLFSKQVPPKETEVNLNTVIKEGLFFLESRCTNSGVQIKLDLEDNIPEIIADPVQLHQVLVNLIMNAVQAMPSGGELTIRSYRNNEFAVFEVEDNGPGMKKEIADKIFLPFFTTKDVNEGTGLGLSVVHGIIEAHKGKVNVETSPGKGAKFKVFLPISHKKEKQE